MPCCPVRKKDSAPPLPNSRILHSRVGGSTSVKHMTWQGIGRIPILHSNVEKVSLLCVMECFRTMRFSSPSCDHWHRCSTFQHYRPRSTLCCGKVMPPCNRFGIDLPCISTTAGHISAAFTLPGAEFPLFLVDIADAFSPMAAYNTLAYRYYTDSIPL